MKALKKLLASSKGAINVMNTVIEVVIVVVLIPVIVGFIATAENLTATETTLLGLVSLFIILALVFGIVKSSGLTKK